uniref:Uncharacterized protein n=1 Tax=Oryza sativa subsp. japonica TaxID=39947 RepID=Q6ZGP7_ORYSJ|nr:hypothetical protein [Oryza sativa Japonica Group]
MTPLKNKIAENIIVLLTVLDINSCPSRRLGGESTVRPGAACEISPSSNHQ